MVPKHANLGVINAARGCRLTAIPTPVALSGKALLPSLCCIMESGGRMLWNRRGPFARSEIWDVPQPG